MQNCQKRGRSVGDYTEQFNLLLINKLNESNEQKVAQYIGCLWTSLLDVLNQQYVCNVSQACQCVMAAEIQRGRGLNRAFFNQSSSSHMVASSGQSRGSNACSHPTSIGPQKNYTNTSHPRQHYWSSNSKPNASN